MKLWMSPGNINTPTNPKWNKVILACNTAGGSLITYGLNTEDHNMIVIGTCLSIGGSMISIFIN